MILLLSLVVLAGGSSGKLDPCWFVAWRFTKAPSKCTEGMCETIVQLDTDKSLRPKRPETGAFSSLSCAQAEAIVSEFVSEQSRAVGFYAPGLLDSLVHQLQRNVVADFGHIFFTPGRQIQLTERTKQVMAWIDVTLLGLMRDSSQPGWIAITEIFKTSQGYRDLIHLGVLIDEWSRATPYFIDVIPGTFGGLINFILDMVSLIERPDSPSALDGWKAAGMIAACGQVSHRRLSRYEFHAHFVPLHEASGEVLLNVAEVIEYVAQTPAETVKLRTVVGLINRMATLDDSPWHDSTSGEAIIRLQFVRKICPVIVRMMPQLVGQWSSVKKLVTALAICRGEIGTSDLIEANRLLGGITGSIVIDRLGEAIPGYDLESLRPVFETASVQRWLFVAQAVHHYLQIHSPLRAGGLFKTPANFASQEHFEKAMRMFGRCLGVFALWGPTVGRLIDLHHSLAKATYQRMNDRELMGLFGISDPRLLVPLVHEPVHFIRLGVQDVAGPLGVWIFHESNWYRAITKVSPI